MVTRTPRVDRIIAAGKTNWPDDPPGAILVQLAEQAINDSPRSASLVRLSGGHRITSEQVADLLDDE